MDNTTKPTYSLEAEKNFIHDLSSPVMIASGWLERWSRRDPGLLQIEEFRKLAAQIERIQALVTARREEMLGRSGARE